MGDDLLRYWAPLHGPERPRGQVNSKDGEKGYRTGERFHREQLIWLGEERGCGAHHSFCIFEMEGRTLELYRIKFSYADFRQLPEQEQLFAVQLAQIANDLRHVFAWLS